jgi:hypothetical protein
MKTETRQDSCSALGPVLFSCRPKPIGRYLVRLHSRHGGPPGKVRTVVHAFESLSAFLAPLFFLIPAILLLGLLQKLLGAAAIAGIVTLYIVMPFVALGIWWYWIASRRDYLVAHQDGFRWRIWLSRMNLFPSSGSVLTADLLQLVHRADWNSIEKKIYQGNMTTAEKLTAILTEISLSSRAAAVRCVNGKEHEIENFMIRFEEEDMNRFLSYLAATRTGIVKSI